jgi:spermidine dehydrogenase
MINIFLAEDDDFGGHAKRNEFSVDGDFDPARDIAGITVNRWAHGYADGYWDIDDPWLGERNDKRRPHVRGRQPFNRITIANSDAGGSAMFESAVLQAHRAIEELK